MKRPFCIFALSDLHLCKKERAKLLDQLRKEIQDFVACSPQWVTPDFLIISGDMIDARDPNYSLVTRTINGFVRSFGISPFHVITTPGNHDRKLPNYRTAPNKRRFLETEIRKYERFAEFNDKNSDYEGFKRDFDPHFEAFSQFNASYLKAKRGSHERLFLGPHLTKDNPSACTSYLKVFPDEHVCFLSVNTEWTDIPDSFLKHLTWEQFSRYRALPKICRPVVYEQLKHFMSHYPDYSLITVMHRNPAELSWTERAAIETDRPDTLQHIFHYSDIIFSGHDHIKRVVTPHLLGNRAQSFQLGSSCMGDRPEDWAHRLIAGLMLVDPVAHTVRFQQFKYDTQENKWKAWNPNGDGSGPCYPLVCKHLNPDRSGIPLPYNVPSTGSPDNIRTIYANSLSPSDVREAFRKQVHDKIEVQCIDLSQDNYKSVLDSSLKGLRPGQKKLYVFFSSSFLREQNPSLYEQRFWDIRNYLLKKCPERYYKGEVSLCHVAVRTRYTTGYDQFRP